VFQRFQRMYEAYEKEGSSEKKQLVSLHQQRVQAMFNRKKRVLMTSYKEELESDTPSVSSQSEGRDCSWEPIRLQGFYEIRDD